MEKEKTDIAELFAEKKVKSNFLKVCAPMVRYSKVQFRSLVKMYDVDLCFTPMILADSFCQSGKARNNEFCTTTKDTPLIAQFAAKTVYDFVGASQLIYPYVDGVDLNCGCPQKWAMKDGYGCTLLSNPETIHSLVRNFKNQLPNSFSVSVKIRLLKDIKETVELCRNLEKCGISFLTVHGRKVWQRNTEPVDIDCLKDIKQSLNIPFIANGNAKNLESATALFEKTGCDGVMAAQGILTNPAMFTDTVVTPIDCIQNWINICQNDQNSIAFQCFHHHLVFMLEKVLNRKQKQIFNYLTSFETVYAFLEETFDIKPSELNNDICGEKILCEYESVDYITLKSNFSNITNEFDSLKTNVNNTSEYNSNSTNGKYFVSKITNNDCDLDYMDSSMFIEPN